MGGINLEGQRVLLEENKLNKVECWGKCPINQMNTH